MLNPSCILHQSKLPKDGLRVQLAELLQRGGVRRWLPKLLQFLQLEQFSVDLRLPVGSDGERFG
jgi:hypothetical protein